MKNVVFSMAMLLGAQAAVAAPATSNPGTPFQMLADQQSRIEQKVNHIDAEVSDYNAIGIPEKVEQVEYKVSLPKVDARVDVKACASLLGQCTAVVVSHEAAMEGNNRPIRMVVLVVMDGVGVEGLGADAFAFDDPFAPAGGAETVPCQAHCGELWFQDGGNGLYSIFLEPPANANWKAGSYAATLTVTVPLVRPLISTVGKGTALVTFEIPPALNIDH